MMASAEPPSGSSLLPLLESLEDAAVGQSEKTDAYLTIASRLSGDEGRQFLPAVEKHFPRLGKSILAHVTGPDAELSQAALQALGFCLYHSHVSAAVPETFAADLLSALCSLVVKGTDKNTCIRALWVISKQSFPPEMVGKQVSSILGALESVLGREDIQSVVLEHEALNVIIRLLEQVPAQMGEGALRWARLVIPLVVHSASKVRLRAAAALETGLPLLLEKQTEVAAIIEPMMSTKLIPELQKLFVSKNETNVLKLWPLFIKLLGKMLHRGGPFINSLLHLEELGFRSSSPTIKKIAFIAWKSLIDNFALNPDILCSSKRMKLLMQPLASINVRTEVLMLTKVEVWWYLVVQLGPNLAPNFDQVSVPLLQCTIGSESSSVPGTPSRSVGQNGAAPPGTPKTGGTPGFNSSANTSRLSLNSSVHGSSSFASIQLLGLEMLLHYFLGPEVAAAAAKNKLTLSLEPLKHPLLSGSSSFTKHAAVLTFCLRDGFINVGKDAPDSLLSVLWTNLVRFVNLSIESAGSKKDRHGGEVLTLMLQALQSIVASEALPAAKVLILLEATVRGIPQRVLGSASYQVGKMDVLNGTPALFLVLLLYNSSMLPAYIEDERFFQCLQTLVGCGLSGPTSPLAFGEAVLGAVRRSAASVQNKEQLWRMWSLVVGPLTDTITQSNEVNQGDALEHNFSAVHSALLFPVTHLLRGTPLQQAAQKSMLSSWAKLYKVFARCSALVVTAEENICCEELCVKMSAVMDRDALMVPSTLNVVSSILQVMVECVDFSPYSPQFQQKLKSPHTPVNWMKKRNKVLGNLSTFQSLLVHCLEVFLDEDSCDATGLALASVMSALFTNFSLPNTVTEALNSLVPPLTLFCKQAASEPPKFSSPLQAKLEKLLSDVLGCLQTRSMLAYDDELLALLSPLLCVMFPHKNKQLRTAVAHFWNSSFGNSVSLTYPEEIRPILSQVKQKTPIILPGFEVVDVPDLSGQYSSESSQLETKLSGIQVSSVGKRDSLRKAAELQTKSSPKTSKPVSTKLDFGSPKPPRRGVLDEEASIDFVFIPPEAKERVLTEHQKEVKRTKRVDIPAMYNNLDASLDTTVFTQYTQSQEDSSDKLASEQADKVTDEEATGKVPQEDVETEEDHEILTKDTQDYASPKAVDAMPENHIQEDMIPESRDVSMEDDTISDKAEDLEMQSKEGPSPDISGSSDLVSGTPQKQNSRRQSFITLEKYAEGKAGSPSSTFTGPLIKTSDSQERSNASKKSSSQVSQTSTSPEPQGSQSSQTGKVKSASPMTDAFESPVRPKDSRKRTEPVKLTVRLASDPTEDEDVIPDTQTEGEDKERTKSTSSSEETKPSSQEEESDAALDDSHSSLFETSQSEPRRSGRPRVRPRLPGESPEKHEDKNTLLKRRRSGEEPKSDSSKSSRPNTRSTQAAEEDDGRLRTRAQTDKSESNLTNSQRKANKKIKLFNTSEDFLEEPEPKKRSTRDSSQTDLLADNESQSPGKQRRRSKASMEKKDSADVVEQANKDEEKPKKDSQIISPSPQTSAIPQEVEIEEQTNNDIDSQTVQDGEKLEKDSQMIASPQIQGQSQGSELIEKPNNEKKNSQIVASPSTNDESGDTTSTTEKSKVKDQLKTREATDDDLSQGDSQVITPSSSESQSRRRSGRSKASSEATGSESKSENKDSLERRSRSNSQASLTADGQPEARKRGRPKKVQEDPSKSSPISIPESSQSLDTAKSSQGLGRKYVRRTSEVLPVASTESGSQEAKEDPPMPKKRGRKPRLSLPSPLTVESKESQITNDMVKGDSDASQKAESQSVEAKADLEDLEKSQNSESLQINTEEQGDAESQVEVDAVDNTKESQSLTASARKEQTQVTEMTTSQEGDTGDLPSADMPESAGISTEQNQEELPCDPSVEDTVEPSELIEKLQAFESSEEKAAEPSEEAAEKQEDDSDSMDQEPRVPAEEPEVVPAEDPEVVAAEDPEVVAAEDPEVVAAEDPEVVAAEDPEVVAAEDPEVVAGEDPEVVPAEDPEVVPAEDPDVVPAEDPEVVAAEDPEVVAGEDPEVVAGEDPEVVAGEDPEVVAGEDPEVVAGEDPEVVAGEDPEVVPAEDPEVVPAEDPEVVPAEDPEVVPAEDPEVVPTAEEGEDLDTTFGEQVSNECENVIDEEQSASSKEGESTYQHTEYTSAESAILERQYEEESRALHSLNDVVANLDAALAQVSPAKQKDLEALMAADLGQSPSSRTRGTWSPTASPSTSILKKGLKRPLEDETPSPIIKSRRVSFANPIHHQEIADDIDRRSPALRTSSPRRNKGSCIPQPKYVTTPTKGLLILSPRNLHSPGYKSSKKCLISEMSKDRPVYKDCIYPALVGCSAPVEAVLPQISSSMWSRGFGQLVRARNIKTVGDLSALTLTEIKTLPIRSPKISNVKKALKNYEQQRKGRGFDELKSLDDLEMMTSELEETSAPQNQDEDDKTSETLATALIDEPIPADGPMEDDCPKNLTPGTPAGEHTPEHTPAGRLQAEVEALSYSMTPQELNNCSSQQLVQIHDQLSGMMRSVVVELQTRICEKEDQR
ncbi:telomere-associated protein RIF1 isoform X1 [Pseudochaenichthys georgianus]|uniref:telomere-associated protein RIF1 isoform X1 n=1 Tax=Pseudochaenichthys georgianus TaxID=52239 RepID=UPI00146D6D8D|nr:telomere-associated protein RIF1 isoform X1 [Pseudochaenichthys georgianus]